EPGATIMEVGRALHAVERALPHGDCPTVALGGLAAGAGFGYATRSLGLTIDFLRRATIVTPDGDSHVASLDSNPDLFWACRGGGGTAGLATELVLDTVAVGRVTGILLCWRWDAAVDGILLYDEILHRAPPELDLKLKIRTTGADRFIDGASAGPPDAIPGTPLMHIDGQFLGGR
ncbi:FAD-binding protein, partial [bacterium]|nr:FAD-binding protein [bacterium]